MSSLQMAQFGVLFLTSVLFAVAFVLGWRHMRRSAEGVSVNVSPDASMGKASRSLVVVGTVVGAGLLVWRAWMERKITLPLSNHFDAFLVLALLLAVVMMYFRVTRHLRGLSFFMLPMIAVLLLLGLVLAIVSPKEYSYESVWTQVHVVTVVSGTVCFALGCVGGAVYLLAARQLKRKGAGGVHNGGRWIGLPPLASMEKFNQWMVYLGFPLLSVAMFAGILRVAQEPEVMRSAGLMWKVGLGVLAWLVYGVLANIPLAPSFRGQRAAWLSIIGFVVFIGGFVAANWAK